MKADVHSFAFVVIKNDYKSFLLNRFKERRKGPTAQIHNTISDRVIPNVVPKKSLKIAPLYPIKADWSR